jgi:putative hydrolase of the HAD superfamily
MQRARAVLFDLDETLYDREQLVRGIFISQYERFRSELAPWGDERFIARGLALDDRGMGDKKRLYATLSAEVPFPSGLADRLHDDFWNRYGATCKPSADTVQTLAELRRHGIKVGVITNGSVWSQQMKLDSLGLDFDVVLISEAEGLRKPDPAIFHRALSQLGVDPKHAVFVGDNPDADVMGARSAGLTPIWKRLAYHESTLPDVVTVTQLSEILPFCVGNGGPGGSDRDNQWPS